MDNYNNVKYTNSEKSWESANTGVQHLALAVLEWGPGEHTDNNKHDRLLETFFRGDTKTMTQWHVEQTYGLRGWWGVRFWVTASWTGKAEAKPEIGRRHCFSTTSGGTTTFAKINGRFKRTVVYMINKSTVYSLSEDESPSRWQWGQSSLLHMKFVLNLLRKNSLSWMLNLLLSLIIFKFSSLKFCHILGNKK